MSQNLLTTFGNAEQRVELALQSLRLGEGVLVVDDESRENEGDLIYSAELMTPTQMGRMIRESSGIVCLCMPESRLQALELPPMVAHNTNQNHTAFSVTIEAKEGVTTGVSAADRITTIQTAIADDCLPSDLVRPGHVFPLCAQEGGVFTRRGHTEGTVDLMRLAGLKPYGVLAEITNPDGTMARLPQIVELAQAWDMVVISIEDLAQYRLNRCAKVS